jgi:16S rRNA (guanine966-N2)-methyltransferase
VRIVAGTFKGRDLTAPQDQRVRPSAELTRAGLLDLLAPDLANARVLDLFAGTGALGLEAISRGAVGADFVEFRPDSLHALKANIAALKLQERTRVFKKDAIPFVAALPAGSYDIAFADPPYGSRMLDRVIDSWKAQRFARIFAVEHATSHVVPKGAKHKLFGDSAITIYRLPEAASS